MLHTISIYVCYIFILSAYMYVIFNGYTQQTVMMVINICSMQIDLLLVFVVDTLHSISKYYFPSFLVILIFNNPSINHFQADFSPHMDSKKLHFVCNLSKHSCHSVFVNMVRSVYTGTYHFNIFLTECFPKVGIL